MSTANDDNPVSQEPPRPLARARRVAELGPEPRRAESTEAKPPEEIPPPIGVTLFRIFCVLATVASAIGAGVSFVWLSNNYYDYDKRDTTWEFIGTLALALGLFTAFVIPLLFAKPRPWIWQYGVVLMALMSLSVYFTVFGIPLLIFWAQARSHNYFRQIREAPRRGRERYGRFDDEDDDEADYGPPPPREPRRFRKSSIQID